MLTNTRLLLHAAVILIVVRLSLGIFPFSRVISRIVSMQRRAASPRAACCSPEMAAWAVRVISKRLPSATCLVQALATQALLARSGRSSALRIGVAKSNDGRFRAHAWVEVEGQVIIGGAAVKQYAILPDVTRTI